MSQQIWKYAIPIKSAWWLTLPQGAQILHVATQHGMGYFWALLNLENKPVARRFGTFGTGENLPEQLTAWSYHGTFLLDEGNEVYHFFEFNQLELPPEPPDRSTKQTFL